jgi:CheY-like chemotaxis protein
VSAEPCRVLYIEDNPADVLLMREALRGASMEQGLSVLTDGAAALLFLQQLEAPNAPVLPDLIFLDLRLPKVDGLEVLRYIKTTRCLAEIPVVAFASASDPNRAAALELSADLCIEKRMDLDPLIASIREAVRRFCPGDRKAATAN